VAVPDAQLAKYNKEKPAGKDAGGKGKGGKKAIDSEAEDDPEELERLTFSLKQVWAGRTVRAGLARLYGCSG